MTPYAQENRLSSDDGPYLEALAADPVAWQPWDALALTNARSRDVPIFISIGHALSPWCRRMREESFLDAAIADRLNDSFVPIAVDRDLRPDIDAIYQTVCRIVEGIEGWPLSAWLTPEGKPFYIGTYFPPEHEDYAPGFGPLVELIAEKWESTAVRNAVAARAEEWAEYAIGDLDSPATVDELAHRDVASFEQVTAVSRRAADAEHGGWGTAGKSAQPSRLQLLLAAYVETGDDRAGSIARTTLDALVDRELRDHIGGGFFLDCARRDWSEPTVEKPLPINAEIARALLSGYQVTGVEEYATAARETFDFFTRALEAPSGGFRAGVGSAKRSGTSGEWDVPYRWTQEELEAALGDPSIAEIAAIRFGIVAEAEQPDPRIPRLAASIDDIADRTGHSPPEVREIIHDARDRLLDNRGDRTQLMWDRRVFAGWNGSAIRALADGAIALAEPGLGERANAACRTLRDRFWDGACLTGRYIDDHCRETQGRPFLDDYAFLGRAALACYEATGDVDSLSFALALTRVVLREFWREGRMMLSPATLGEDLIVSPQVTLDDMTAPGISTAVELLVTLDGFTPTDEFGTAAEQLLATYGPRIQTDLLQHHSLAMASEYVRTGPTALTLVAEELPDRWRQWIAGRYFPRRLVAPRPPGDISEILDIIGLDKTPPIWTADGDDSRPYAIILWRGKRSNPLYRPQEAEAWLNRQSGTNRRG